MRIKWFKVKNGKVIDEATLQHNIIKYGVPITILIVSSSSQVLAESSISTKLKPIIALLQDLVEPVAYCFMIYGGLKIISGHKSTGLDIIKDAAAGYVLVQWIPWLFDIIRTIGRS